MARIRSVKPEFWEDETIGLLSVQARLLFIATWNLADDEGLLRWSPAYLKANAFMYDVAVGESDLKAYMDELVSEGLIFPYVAGKAQQQLAFIVNFRKHQNINRPGPGRLPPPSTQSRAVAQMYGRRDGWLCHLCGLQILQKPAGMANAYDGEVDQRAAGLSLDHVVPQSQGGTDYPSNIAAAHLSCNKTRCDRPLDQVDRKPTATVLRALEAAGVVNVPVDEAVDEPAPVVSVNDSVSDSGPGARAREQGAGSREGEQGRVNTVVAQARPRSVDRVVFEAWQQATGKTRAKLDAKRRRAIQRALAAYPLDDVLDAVAGWRNDPWTERPRYNDLTLLLRDADHVEKFRDLARHGPPPPVLAPRQQRERDHLLATHQELTAWAEEVDGNAGNGMGLDRGQALGKLPRPGTAG